jgi:hypothetical protein
MPAQFWDFLFSCLFAVTASMLVWGEMWFGTAGMHTVLYALHAFIVPYLAARKSKVFAGSLLGVHLGSSPIWLILVVSLLPGGSSEGLMFSVAYLAVATGLAVLGGLTGRSRYAVR